MVPVSGLESPRPKAMLDIYEKRIRRVYQILDTKKPKAEAAFDSKVSI